MAAAGRKPAMKSAAIERSVRLASTTIIRHGGTSTPIADAAATIETASSGLYPARVIEGISNEPTADTSAAEEPEIAHHGGHAEAAADVADERARESDQSLGDAARVHEIAGEHEERQREQQ